MCVSVETEGRLSGLGKSKSQSRETERHVQNSKQHSSAWQEWPKEQLAPEASDKMVHCLQGI